MPRNSAVTSDRCQRTDERNARRPCVNSALTKSTTTHEKNIYQMVYDGIKILLDREVDDLALACPNADMANKLIMAIGDKLKLSQKQRSL